MCIFIFISRKRERKRGERKREREREKKNDKKKGRGERKLRAVSLYFMCGYIYIYCIYILYIIVQRERRWMVREPAGALSRFLSSIFFSLDACVW